MTVATTTGLTLDELAARLPRHHARWLKLVVLDELERGRIERDDAGAYRLVREAFPPALLAALVALELDTEVPTT